MALPPAGEDVYAIQQTFLTTRVSELDSRRKKFFLEVIGRRSMAYILKAISVFGAIIVAAKISWTDQTILGLVIAAAVGIDQITSNHARLLAIAAARHACDRLRAKIVAKHSQALPGILRLRGNGNPEDTQRYENTFHEMMGDLLKDLHDGQEAILEAVREADLKALNNLYVDK